MRKLFLLLLVLSILTTGDVDQALAAGLTSLEDTVWDLEVDVKASIKKVGSVNESGTGTLSFGAETFSFTDNQGDVFTGTYQESPDKPGKGIFELTATEQAFDDYLLNKMEDIAVGADDVTITYTPAVIIAKTNVSKKGTTISFNVKISGNVSVMTGDYVQITKMSVNVKVKGDTESALPGTGESQGSKWQINTETKIKIPGLGSMPYPGHIELMLGPLDAEQIGEGQFMFIDEEDFEQWGTFTQNKNKIAALGLNEYFQDVALENLIDLLYEEEVYDFYGAYVDPITDLSVTATIKGDSITLSVKAKFTGGVYIEGELETGKGSITIKGTGTQIN
ncbi:MAG: hypothetical protein JW860_07030 [Sedimentisphaerales bacterium]|nr:hypothetical protein [Sedimentisphaerales bacterium]